MEYWVEKGVSEVGKKGWCFSFCSQPFYWMWLCGNAKLFAAWKQNFFSVLYTNLYIIYIYVYIVIHICIWIYCKNRQSEIVTQNGRRAKIIKRKSEKRIAKQQEKPITHSINVGWMGREKVFVCDKQMPRTFLYWPQASLWKLKVCVYMSHDETIKVGAIYIKSYTIRIHWKLRNWQFQLKLWKIGGYFP